MNELAAHQNDLLAAILATIAGGLIRGFSGFGPSLVMAPVLSYLIGPAQAVATIILVNIPANLIQLPGVYRRAHWREVIPLSIAQSLTIPIGTYVLTIADPQVMRRVIATLVVLAAISIWRGWRYHGPRGPRAAMGMGAFAGLLTGSTALGGPPVALYMLAGSYRPDIMRASFVALATIIQVSSIISLSVAGVITSETLLRASAAAPAFLLGFWAGGALFARVDERNFRRGILTLLIIVSLAILLS